MITLRLLILMPLLAFAPALSVVSHAAENEVPLEVLEDLHQLGLQQLEVLDADINEAERRWLSLLVGKSTIPNRPARTVADITAYFGTLRDELDQIRRDMFNARERWQRGSRKAEELLPRIYRRQRAGLRLVWQMHRAEARQRVHGLLTDQRTQLAALNKEWTDTTAELQRRFGLDSAEYKANLKRYNAILERKRERKRKDAMQRDYADATEQLLAGRRFLCGEAWRWVDIARRRGDADAAHDSTAFVYLEFAHRLRQRPAQERERLGVGSGGSSLDTLLDSRDDELEIRTFNFWEPTEKVRMNQALAGAPVEQLRQFDDSPLPAIVDTHFRIVDRKIDIGTAQASRLQTELGDAEEGVQGATVNAARAQRELAAAQAQLADIDAEVERFTNARDAALSAARDLEVLSETAVANAIRQQMETNSRRINAIHDRIDALKAKDALTSDEIGERTRLLEEYDLLQQQQVQGSADLDRLRTPPSDEAQRQLQRGQQLEEMRVDALRRRIPLRNAYDQANAAAETADKAVLTAEQQALGLREQLLISGAAFDGRLTDIWVRAEDTKTTCFRQESFFDLQKSLAEIERGIMLAQERLRLLERSREDRDKDQQRFNRERKLAGEKLETQIKRSGRAQAAFKSLVFLFNTLGDARTFGPIGGGGRALLEGILGYLNGGLKIEDVDFAAVADISWNEQQLAKPLPPGVVRAIKSRGWSEALRRELDDYLASDASLEVLASRLEDVDRVARWIDTIEVQIDPLFTSLTLSLSEDIDVFFRSDAVAAFVRAQTQATIATQLKVRIADLVQDARFDLRREQQRKDRILNSHDARAGLVTTESIDFWRDTPLEIFIGHDRIAQLKLEVIIGGKSAMVVGDTLIPKEDRNQPARRFRFPSDQVEAMAHDGKGGLTLVVRAVPE